MAFRKKACHILAYNPDILIIPECEHPGKLKYTSELPIHDDFLWYGTNQSKGLGIFSYNGYRLSPIVPHNQDIKMIIPLHVSKGSLDFNLFAIWAYNPLDKEGRYIEQVRKAIVCYDNLMKKEGTVLIGDFNSNSIWDKEHRTSNHTNIVNMLEEKGIHSLYHRYHKQIQGKELHPTFYMYRHSHRPYHIDYCFASEDLVGKLKTIEVGNYSDWIQYSDHVPLIVDFDIPAPSVRRVPKGSTDCKINKGLQTC